MEPSNGTVTRHNSTETSLVHLMRENKFVHHHLNLVADKKKHILRRMEKMRTGLDREDFPSDEFEVGTLLGNSRASSRHLMRAEKSEKPQVLRERKLKQTLPPCREHRGQPTGTHPAPRRRPPGVRAANRSPPRRWWQLPRQATATPRIPGAVEAAARTPGAAPRPRPPHNSEPAPLPARFHLPRRSGRWRALDKFKGRDGRVRSPVSPGWYGGRPSGAGAMRRLPRPAGPVPPWD